MGKKRCLSKSVVTDGFIERANGLFHLFLLFLKKIQNICATITIVPSDRKNNRQNNPRYPPVRRRSRLRERHPRMSDRARIYPSGMIVDGIIRYRKCDPLHRRTLAVETTRRFRFFSPLPTRWRAMQRLKDVLEQLYGNAAGPDWEVSYQYGLPVEAPLSMRGHEEGFLPPPETVQLADGWESDGSAAVG